MSWSWNEQEEEKIYEMHGTVTISTEEYRDLIRGLCELRAKGQKEHDDWRHEYTRANDLEKRLKSCEEKLIEINSWLDSDDSLRPKFKLWKVERLEKDENHE